MSLDYDLIKACQLMRRWHFARWVYSWASPQQVISAHPRKTVNSIDRKTTEMKMLWS